MLLKNNLANARKAALAGAIAIGITASPTGAITKSELNHLSCLQVEGTGLANQSLEVLGQDTITPKLGSCLIEMFNEPNDNVYNNPGTLQNSLAAVLGGDGLLSKVLPYLHAVAIVEKEIVCRQWKEKCNLAIIDKGKQVKKGFDNNAELCNAVKRYCEGNRDDTENIAEEYGYLIGKWNASRVEDFSHAFSFKNEFNKDIGAWDVGNATEMHYMFYCARLFNQSLSGWDVSNARNMCRMFEFAESFNKSLSGLDVSNVDNMRCMFQHAHAFNGDVSAWDTSSITKMNYMFYYAMAFNQDLSTWDTSSITNMASMFSYAFVFN